MWPRCLPRRSLCCGHSASLPGQDSDHLGIILKKNQLAILIPSMLTIMDCILVTAPLQDWQIREWSLCLASAVVSLGLWLIFLLSRISLYDQLIPNMTSSTGPYQSLHIELVFIFFNIAIAIAAVTSITISTEYSVKWTQINRQRVYHLPPGRNPGQVPLHQVPLLGDGLQGEHRPDHGGGGGLRPAGGATSSQYLDKPRWWYSPLPPTGQISWAPPSSSVLS